MKPVELLRRRLNPNSSSAPLDSRYQLAKLYFRRGLWPSMHDDDDTRELHGFLVRRQKIRHDPDQAISYTPRQQAISVAFDLHHGNLERLRPMLEPFLLTEWGDSVIASKFGVPSESVRLYRRLFYDVERWRNYPARIMQQVIGIADEQGQMKLSAHAIWKLVGYRCGAATLSQLLRIDNQSPGALVNPVAELASESQTMMRIKELFAAGALDPENPAQIIALLNPRTHGRRTGPSDDELQMTWIEKHVSAMIEDIPWMVGDEGEKILEGTTVGEYDKLPGSMRDDELMRISAGEDIPGLKEELSQTLPPPRKCKAALDEFAKSLGPKMQP